MDVKEKHSPYYKLLTAFHDFKGCILCELESGYLYRYFENMFYESVNDYGLRQKLTKSRGFCSRHINTLLSVQDALGTAILYKDQLSIFCRFLDKIRHYNFKSLHSMLDDEMKSRNLCPACVSQRQFRRDKIETFLEWLDDNELKQAFEASAGFCREHLFAVLEQNDDENIRKYLIDIHLGKYEQLLLEVEEFIRKNDYQFNHEGFGKEGNSWLRTVKMLNGSKNIF